MPGRHRRKEPLRLLRLHRLVVPCMKQKDRLGRQRRGVGDRRARHQEFAVARQCPVELVPGARREQRHQIRHRREGRHRLDPLIPGREKQRQRSRRAVPRGVNPPPVDRRERLQRNVERRLAVFDPSLRRAKNLHAADRFRFRDPVRHRPVDIERDRDITRLHIRQMLAPIPTAQPHARNQIATRRRHDHTSDRFTDLATRRIQPDPHRTRRPLDLQLAKKDSRLELLNPRHRRRLRARPPHLPSRPPIALPRPRRSAASDDDHQQSPDHVPPCSPRHALRRMRHCPRKVRMPQAPPPKRPKSRRRLALDFPSEGSNLRGLRGINSVVECQLPKLNVVGSSPISRSRHFKGEPRQHVVPLLRPGYSTSSGVKAATA